MHYIPVPEELRPKAKDIGLIYPPCNELPFEEYYNNFIINYGDKYPTKRKLIPVNTTAYYVKNNYGKNIQVLQDLFNSLPRNQKYYIVTQYDDSIINDISGLDIKIYSAGGGNGIPIPLMCQLPFPWPKEKDIFCSFVGRNTHPIRDAIFKMGLPSDKFLIIETSKMPYSEYMDIMARSVFALCPRGYGKSSFRIAEALNVGTVPIYISDEFWINDKMGEFPGLLMKFVPEFETLNRILVDCFFAWVNGARDKVVLGQKYFDSYYRYDSLKNWIIKDLQNE